MADKTTKPIATSEIVQIVKNLFFALIGAVVLGAEETEKVIEKLIDRGEKAQKDLQKRIGEIQKRTKKNVLDLQLKVNENFQKTLKRFGVAEEKEKIEEKAA